MKTIRAALLFGGLLALVGQRGVADDADPEPPPPIKVENVSGATVTVSSGGKGVVLKVTTTPLKAKAKAKGKVKTRLRVASCQVSFTEKQAPGRVTFQFKNHDQLTQFWVTNQDVSLVIQGAGGKGKEVHHLNATGNQVT